MLVDTQNKKRLIHWAGPVATILSNQVIQFYNKAKEISFQAVPQQSVEFLCTCCPMSKVDVTAALINMNLQKTSHLLFRYL